MEKRFEYSRPEESETEQHTIELVVKGEKVGDATLEYHSRPFPFYLVTFVEVEFGQQGQGYGSELVEKINEFLNTRNRPGVLEDAINENNPARGFYERHGWKRIADTSWFVYNLNPDLEKKVKRIKSVQDQQYDRLTNRIMAKANEKYDQRGTEEETDS